MVKVGVKKSKQQIFGDGGSTLYLQHCYVYIKPKAVEPIPRPCVSRNYVHQIALYCHAQIMVLITFEF
jgi:hypothetical protein